MLFVILPSLPAHHRLSQKPPLLLSWWEQAYVFHAGSLLLSWSWASGKEEEERGGGRGGKDIF